jgi:hypothetical protein
MQTESWKSEAEQYIYSPMFLSRRLKNENLRKPESTREITEKEELRKVTLFMSRTVANSFLSSQFHS